MTVLLVIGKSGQLAQALLEAPSSHFRIDARGRDALDLTDTDALAAAVRALRPAAVINASAYTAVDKAETDEAAAFALNRDAPAALARLCAEIGAPLVHVSTDYVFDGSKSAPYIETDPKAPLGVYGASKSAGEDAVHAAGCSAAVLRTSWVYSPFGSNFVKTMLRLAGSRDSLSVVADQIGRPTSATELAAAALTTVQALLDGDQAVRGVIHVAGAEDATWADFADAVFQGSAARGGATAAVQRITTAEYPTAAKRPANSRLDTAKMERVLGIRPRPWRLALRETLDRLIVS
jgi:dTDP-4-dehydrorhamnose reductase